MGARGVEVVDDAAGLEAASRLPIAALFAVEPQQSEPRSPRPEGLARKAIELLSGSGRPFFLLVEDEEIDTAAHANDGVRMSRALHRFDGAVAAAADFASKDGETLVLVMGDHATGGLTIDSRSRGREIALLWGGRGHTGEPVPVFAYGPPAAAGRFGGLFEWLRQNVHGVGASLSAQQLITNATGKPLTAAPWLRYAEGKYLDEAG